MSNKQEIEMSNTICVKLPNGKSDYYPFRWNGEILEAFIQKVWVTVSKTLKVNQHGDYIFITFLNCSK
jgi:hypothetical protein